MANILQSLGEQKVTGTYFYQRDHTHTSARGAVLAASIIARELHQSKNSIKEYILEEPVVDLPKKQNIFLVGDSTMADNGDENAVGWGVYFSNHLDTTRTIILNKARGGRSSRTFRYEGLWDSILQQLQPKDYVLLQFGHNDAGNIDSKKFRGSLKGVGDETQKVKRPNGEWEEVHTYGWYMKKYIEETQEKGAIPIVLSLTVRNEWPNDKVEQRDSTYVKWTEEVAKIKGVVYLDISDSLAVAYQQLGKEKVAEFFPRDHTHTGNEGAAFNAMIIAKSLNQEKESGIRDYIYVQDL